MTISVGHRYNIPEDSITFPLINTFKPSKHFSDYAKVIPNNYGGFSLVAAQDILQPGQTVAQFEGPRVEYDQCTEYDKRYVLIVLDEQSQEWKYLLPLSDARFANHGCEPNCVIDADNQIVTVKPIKEGEEFLYIYNKGEEKDWWDPVWTFKCECGSEKCQGLIDRYRQVEEPQLPNIAKSKAMREKQISNQQTIY